MKRQFKKIARFLFEKLQILGIDLLPRHFYSEIPDIKKLRENGFWKHPRTMVGINGVEINEQLEFLKNCCSRDLIERQKRKDIYIKACQMNGEAGFGRIESDFLFCFIRAMRPARIIQVGAGLSTAVISLATKESGYRPAITVIDPYPTKFLEKASREGEIKLIEKEAQRLPLKTFLDLEEGDLLFIDSTHTVKPGSEVNFLILEVLPRLRKGVYVHFHDIYFPYDYKRDLLSDALFFSNESVLLQAFLSQNYNYRIMLSMSMLHYATPDELKKYLPNYIPQVNNFGLKTNIEPEGHFPSSSYLLKLN